MLAQRNCRASGNPESAFPAGNFGLDSNIDTGLTDPGNDVASILQHVIGWVFAGIASLLSVVFSGLGLVFNFDLFRSGASRIPGALGSAESQFTVPFLPVALVVGGIVSAVYLARADHGRAVGHLAAMAAMVIAGLVMIAAPGATLGWLDGVANGGAQGSLSAFSGAGGGTVGSYADATPALWRTMVEEPWCALEFGDVTTWCMAPITPAMRTARDAVVAHLDQAAGDQASTDVAKQQESIERTRLAAATTNGELFLSFPVNWDARNGKNDTWTLYHALIASRPDLASIRSGGGVGERITTLLLVGLGVIFLVLLFLYITLYLLVASIFFIILLLFAPVMVLAPAFGERGRRAFTQWFGMLIGALAARVVYAIYLGVLVGTSALLTAIGPSVGGWLDQWILFAALWAMGWHYRQRLPELLTGGAHHGEHHGHAVGMFAAGGLIGAAAVRHGRRGAAWAGSRRFSTGERPDDSPGPERGRDRPRPPRPQDPRRVGNYGYGIHAREPVGGGEQATLGRPPARLNGGPPDFDGHLVED